MAAAAAVGVLVGFAGISSMALVGVGLAGLAVTAAGLWWFVTRRGLLRLLALALVAGAPVAVLVLYTLAHLTWVVLLSGAVWALAVSAGRAALSRDAPPVGMPEYPAPPTKRPFLIMNPRSGGGKVAKFGLKEKAEALGAEVALLGGPETVDVAELAGKAADAGADLLGVAGGDGTQAIVAGVAERHLPLLVVSAGTRNHFALDLGLDREDPSTCLEAALVDGVELHVDLAFLGGRPFVNNASFGAYAAVVQSSAYRDDKVGTTLEMLPDLLAGHRGPRLHARAGQVSIDGPQAVLVSNNPYGTVWDRGHRRSGAAGTARRRRARSS